MSSKDTGQSKTEKATPQKLKKARDEGQVPRSKDLASSALIIGCSILLTTTADWIASKVAEMTRVNMSFTKAQLDEPGMMMRHLAYSLLEILNILGPLFLMVGIIAIITGAMPGGPVLSFKNASFKYSRIDPIAGLGRIASVKSLVELVKSILKIVLLISIMLLFLEKNFQTLMAISQLPIDEAVSRGIDMLSLAMLYLGLGLLVITFIDVPYQYWHHHKELKMSLQEVKDEHKQQDGKPEVKAKIRQMQQRISRSRADVSIPKADVLLVNPNHYAVALKYELTKADAPYVVAKGTDELALYMRDIAKRHGVEVVELPPLTRAIYYSTQVEQQIPAGLFVAIAHVLTYVMQLQAARQGQQAKPDPLPHFFIPTNLQHD
ncbi:flagellar biosynthesis protein FlhB [Shewanella sp. Choline-02u-19]|jgi:flagellar biosynthetic protein FlhB|uniref:flagellar biosynthesis protein FlhB n=1 Tax=unclassified Shewanella TaxID=196818 RepID=UPI000C31C4E4|nr:MULTISPECIES: flagellar biosynthesis protein FlhB [unclassified Shewanella]PKG58867.1 flagellar biosynthesis protein FlhB [Shewanella sp. GutDb-MelDb]PKH57247.1 flagellar biosynthesis protein FlhB [Shewanella sp. Bg11-22]PKI29639.1 flagellar biosynthesis protein FlhB [Shewanella sp. Choline-02u-19]